MDQVSMSASQFHAVTAPTVNLVKAGEGINLYVLGVLVILKALGNETGGSYSLFEDIVPPGVGPPPHFHTNEAETWYMLEGELLWKVGDEEFNATKGSFVNLPRFVPHSFINKSDRPAHMVLTYAPAGFETWFLDVGKEVKDPTDPPPKPTKEDIALALKYSNAYGVVFLEPQHPPE